MPTSSSSRLEGRWAGMLRPLRTVYEYLVLYYGLGLLGLICLSWTVIAAVLYPLLPRRWGEVLGRYVIMAGFRFYLAAIAVTGTCRFDLSALDALRSQGPMIIAPNHPSLLDAVMVLSRLPDVVCVMKAALLDNIFLGAGARLARYIRNDSLVRLVGKASESLREGSQLLIFPEGTRSTRLPVNAFKGAVGGNCQTCRRARADRFHRDRFAVSLQGMAAVSQAFDADALPGAPGSPLRSACRRASVPG